MTMPPTKKIAGKKVLDHEGGNRFYHRHLSPKARAKKKKARKAKKKARK